jgi:riboflavin biosynthesis pyrimidine reductase
MRRLLPDPADDVDLTAAYAPPATGRFLRLNMISSLDGAITIDGKSGGLGGAGDHAVFGALRASADVVLVGAGTARAEKYGPVRLDAATQQARVARGQAPQPPIAVVSLRGDFDFAVPFFTEATTAPVIITTEPQAAALAPVTADGAVEVLGAGGTAVDLAAALEQLAQRGARVVLAEGGPRLNGDLVRAGLLDELCLTVSPRLVGGEGPRVVAGAPLVPTATPSVVHLLEDDGFLFFRLDLR